jgi:hypothetical protein
MKTGLRICLLTILILAAASLTACFFQGGTPAPSSNNPPDTKTAPISSTISSPKSSLVPYTPVIGDPVISEMETLNGSDNGITTHNYSPNNGEFAYQIMSGKNYVDTVNKSPIQAKYLGRSDKGYNFEMVGSNTPFSIGFSSWKNYEIKLTQGMTYLISSQFVAGFPSAYGLIISQGNEIIFAGVTDWYLNGVITIDNGFWPLAYPTFDIKLDRVLKDNYMEVDNESEFIKVTNLEVQFTLGNKIFSIRQGQSAILGDYKIDLMMAVDKDIQYKKMVADGGSNGFSFVLTKLVESEPLSKTSPGNNKVQFTDPSLDTAIRKTLGIYNLDITKMDLVGLTVLRSINTFIQNLDGLENCLALRVLDLQGNQIRNFSAISQLKGLNTLNLMSNKISDFSSFDFSALNSLISLSLNKNEISDISELFNATSLQGLDLSDNNITNISALTNLTKIYNLNLVNNQVIDISPLANLTSLSSLRLMSNKITDISALSSLTELKMINLAGNKISDIEPLVTNIKLGKGTQIYLDGNRLNEKSINEYIPELKKRGVEVSY